MPSNIPSSRQALWLALTTAVSAWPLHGLAAAAGTLQFTTGEVQLRRGTVAAAAVKGAEVESGDVIVTGAAGRAQIRFSDGGLVALYPDSQFTVTSYADAGQASGDQFSVNLLKGGMRAITGWIGKRDPRNYKVTTPTAVVGIRGSAFLIGFNAQGELVVSGEQDEIEVCTEAGCVGVKAGESVRVVASNQLPLYTHTRAALPLPPPPPPFAMGQQLGLRDVPAPPPTGVPSVPTPPPTTGTPTPPPTTGTPTPPPTTGTPTPPPTGGQTPPPTGTTPPPAPTTPPVIRPPIVLPPIVIVRPPIFVLPPPPPVIP